MVTLVYKWSRLLIKGSFILSVQPFYMHSTLHLWVFFQIKPKKGTDNWCIRLYELNLGNIFRNEIYTKWDIFFLTEGRGARAYGTHGVSIRFRPSPRHGMPPTPPSQPPGTKNQALDLHCLKKGLEKIGTQARIGIQLQLHPTESNSEEIHHTLQGNKKSSPERDETGKGSKVLCTRRVLSDNRYIEFHNRYIQF